MSEEQEPLPEPMNFSDVQIEGNDKFNAKWAVYGFTADQMRAYAAAAVAREREKIAAMIAPEHLVFSDEEWRLRCELADAIRGGD